MTSLLVAVDDDTLVRLQRIVDETRKEIPQVAQIRLKAGAMLPPGRNVVISGEALDRMATILGGGSVANEADLLKKIERLAGISFLHIRLPFTPNQLELLADKAARNSLTVDQLVERTAPRIYEQFFDLMSRV